MQFTGDPAFPVRGYMLDISRDRVPTRETLDWLVGVLAQLRINELQLYTEHTFAWVEHEDVWGESSPMTADDLAWLRQRCSESDIELVPCLNTFGHMERFLAHERHRHRAECPDGAPRPGAPATDAAPPRRPPTTLAPTPDNAEFALGLVREYLAALPSRRVHVGGDEPFELGRCRSADDVAARGRSAVYVEHLRRIVDPLLAEDHDVLFWGDIVRDQPDLVGALPEGLTAVAWHYEAPWPDAPPLSELIGAELAEVLGMPEDALVGFGAHTRTFAATGMPFRVAPGASTWNSLLGRWPSARANIDDAVATGRLDGAVGIQLTDWGDNGHHQPPAVSLLPLVHYASTAWHGTPADPADVLTTVDEVTGVDGLGRRLDTLGRVHERLGVRSMNSSPLWEAVVRPPRGAPGGLADDREVRDVLELLDDAVTGHDADDGTPATIGLAAAADLAWVGVARLAHAAGRAVAPVQEIDARLAGAIDRHADAWGRVSRPGGLGDSLRRLHTSTAR